MNEPIGVIVSIGNSWAAYHMFGNVLRYVEAGLIAIVMFAIEEFKKASVEGP